MFNRVGLKEVRVERDETGYKLRLSNQLRKHCAAAWPRFPLPSQSCSLKFISSYPPSDTTLSASISLGIPPPTMVSPPHSCSSPTISTVSELPLLSTPGKMPSCPFPG